MVPYDDWKTEWWSLLYFECYPSSSTCRLPQVTRQWLRDNPRQSKSLREKTYHLSRDDIPVQTRDVRVPKYDVDTMTPNGLSYIIEVVGIHRDSVSKDNLICQVLISRRHSVESRQRLTRKLNLRYSLTIGYQWTSYSPSSKRFKSYIMEGLALGVTVRKKKLPSSVFHTFKHKMKHLLRGPVPWDFWNDYTVKRLHSKQRWRDRA